jgi:hypothetical protein
MWGEKEQGEITGKITPTQKLSSYKCMYVLYSYVRYSYYSHFAFVLACSNCQFKNLIVMTDCKAPSPLPTLESLRQKFEQQVCLPTEHALRIIHEALNIMDDEPNVLYLDAPVVGMHHRVAKSPSILLS